MNEQEFQGILLHTASEQNIALTEAQARLCSSHISFMLEWNSRQNLTRITEPKDIISKHLLDSIIPARWLPDHGATLDVGSGPGFPGVPLKLIHPGLQVDLLEANHKKVTFLRALLSHLGVEGIRAVEGRSEELSRTIPCLSEARYDLVVMRAVRLEAKHLKSLAARILNPGGVFAWWAGPTGFLEWKKIEGRLGRTPVVFENDFTYSLPSDSGSRHLLVWRKAA